jgi:hypothetical protein
MGMYTTIEDNSELIVDEKLKDFEGEWGEWLYDFLTEEFDEAKFYGYWNNEMMSNLKEIGRLGLVKGECTVRYEGGDLIKCWWDEKGFKYKRAQVVFPEKWME